MGQLRSPAIARIPAAGFHWTFIDTKHGGFEGVIFPRVESPELLEKEVSWTRFPPLGVRGYGLTAIHLNHEAVSFREAIEHLNVK